LACHTARPSDGRGGWFTEVFGTRDLKETKTLLDELP
jgi:hypothetical protein